MDVTNRITTVVGVTGVTNSIGQIKQLQSTVTNLKAELEQFGITGRSVAELAAGVALLTAGFKLMGMAIRDARSELQATRRLKFALGSAGAANNAVGESGALSVKYGIDDSVINSTFASMANFGVKADDLSKSFEAIADLASLGGSRANAEDVFNKLRRALATGQITGIAMRGLVGEGVPIQQILAEYMAKTQGGSEKDWQKKLGKSGFTVPGGMDPMQFIVEAMKTSKYKGQALEEARGTFGSIDRIRASISEIFEDTGKMVIRVLKPLTQALAALFEWFVKINEALGGGLGLIVITGLFTAGIGLTIRALVRCTLFLNAFKLTLDRIAASAGIASGANTASAGSNVGKGIFGGAVGTWLATHLKSFKNLWTVIKGALGWLLNQIVFGVKWIFTSGIAKLLGYIAAGLAVAFGIGALGQKVFDAPNRVLESNPLLAKTKAFFKAMQDASNVLNWKRFNDWWHDLFHNDPRDKSFNKKWWNEVYNRNSPEEKKVASDTERIRIATEKMAEGVLWGNQGWRGQAYLGSWQARAAHGKALAPTGAAG